MSYRDAPRILFPELESVKRLRESRAQEMGVKGMRWGQKKATGEPEEQRGKTEQSFWDGAVAVKNGIEAVSKREKELSFADKFRLSMARSAAKSANQAYLSGDMERASKIQGKARQILDRISKNGKE